jgi:hypothetical protein
MTAHSHVRFPMYQGLPGETMRSSNLAHRGGVPCLF